MTSLMPDDVIRDAGLERFHVGASVAMVVLHAAVLAALAMIVLTLQARRKREA